MRRALLIVALLTLIVTACGRQTPPTEPPSIMIDRPTAGPTRAGPKPTPAQQAALTALSGKTGLPAAQIKLVSTEAVTWPDGCLGIVKMGVMCTQAQVPGFKIVLEAKDQQYEYHTNQDGSVVELAEAAQGAGAGEQAVIEQLAANLGLQESEISVASSEAVEFGDACLGVQMPDVMCAQVVTPGRIIVLEADGVQYEYHTSEDGSRVQPATLAMIWKREGGIAGFCDTLTVFLSGEVYATQCKPQSEGKMGTFASLLSRQEQAQFMDWMASFAMTNLDASDPRGVSDRMMVTLQVFGNGTKPPSEEQQQAMFGFAQDLYQALTK